MNIKTKKKGGFALVAGMMLFLFNAPIVSVANKIAFIYDIPVLYLYLFTVWIFCILLLYIISSLRSSDRTKKL